MRFIKKSLVLLLAVTFVVLSALPVAASQATSYTYTLDDDSELVRLLSKLKEECKEDALNIELDNQFSVYGEFIAKGNF